MTLRPHAAVPQPLELPVRYLDDDLVVVVKPAGMATHPGPGWWQGSCVNALLFHIPTWPGVGGVAGPGIVHRLDVETSGLLLFARSQRAHRPLLETVAQRRMRRGYLAWVEGQVDDAGWVEAPLGRDDHDTQRVVVRSDGKAALTHYAPLCQREGRSLLRLQLETGRTHQIRVHMAHRGWPVVGDRRYGTAGPVMALHAGFLALAHPITGEPLQWIEGPPATWDPWGELPDPAWCWPA
ncbi:MAG: RluA family pseudouridine synthase [Candidatus Sericytochromatia bacterium]|nr:RluA family pseudouridine synthase [Candidatus Sericytochromatia bacterium]